LENLKDSLSPCIAESVHRLLRLKHISFPGVHNLLLSTLSFCSFFVDRLKTMTFQ
jgi:hypothetical protein